MHILAIVSFLDEEQYLPELLESLAGQTRFPDELLLVDDGSTDDSARIAEAFAGTHEGVRVLRRPRRPPDRDRLASAAELIAFQEGLATTSGDWDVAAKIDADVRFTAQSFATIERAFEREPRLGIAGAYLSAVARDGRVRRARARPQHLRGPNNV